MKSFESYLALLAVCGLAVLWVVHIVGVLLWPFSWGEKKEDEKEKD